ncbi:MAG: universal stress protein [Actinomycetota bacterium]|nr:universal stress protein [Actinomycetota bacterium]
MSTGAVVAISVAALALGTATGYWLPPHGRRPFRNRPGAVRRILLPFTGQAISRRAFEAAVRLARAENAVIMPAFLARVPMDLPLTAPLRAQCAFGMPLMEAIEQRAASQGIQVDSRISRGRSYRDALRHLLEQETFDRVIVSASNDVRMGLSSGDLEWLLRRVPAEVLILRPAPEDTRNLAAAGMSGAFHAGRGPDSSPLPRDGERDSAPDAL